MTHLKLTDLQDLKPLLDAGLTRAEIEAVHAQRQSPPLGNGLFRRCPDCGHLHEDRGEALDFCFCGYCRHAVLTSGVCEHCGQANPKIPILTPEHFDLHEKPAIARQKATGKGPTEGA